MNKEDLKLVGSICLFISYLIFGITCAYATFEVTKETGFFGFFTGATMTLLMFIPAWHIGKNFFHNLFN
jgi:hypothetical protein